MRVQYVLAIAAFLIVAGCHHEAPVEAPKTVVALYADLLSKMPSTAQATTYDLRTADGQAALKAALKPYDATLDEAHGVLNFPTYSEGFMVATGRDDPGMVKTAVALKNLLYMLVARARLACAGGQISKGREDFNAAARVAVHASQNSGSALQVLVDVALREIVLTGLRETTMDTSLDAANDRALSKIAESLLELAPLSTAMKQELRATGEEARSKPKEAAKDRKQIPIIIAALSKEGTDSAGTLKRLRALSGTDAFPADAAATTKMSDFQWTQVIYKEVVKVQADTRMTIAFFNALAEDDAHGKLPNSLPASGALARDPFGSGQLSYRAKTGGFTLTAPASKGILSLPSGATVETLAYPLKSYVPAKI